MPPGPRPKPTHLKIREGNPGKRALNEREPQPPKVKKTPRAPGHLSKDAQREWRRVAKILTEQNVVSVLDLPALEAYCVCYAQWVEANAQVGKLGAIVKTANGNLIQNPYLAVANRAMVEMRKWMAEMGMTPSSRSRVQVLEDGSTDDDFFGF